MVVYILAGFALSAYVDYAAWKFKRERYLTKPYLSLVNMLEAHFRVTEKQISNATARLEGLTFERGMPEETEFQRTVRDSVGQVKSIQQDVQSLYAEIRPLLAHWSGIVSRSNRLAWRLRARFVSLWLLDIIVPVGLAGLAIWRTYEGIPIAISKVAG